MQNLYRRIVPVLLTGLCLGVIAGSAHAQSATPKKPGAKIQGDPIVPPPDAGQTPPADAAKPAKPANGPSKVMGENGEVEFEDLASYEFDTPETLITNQTTAVTTANKQIPPAIKSLDGMEVSITGFLLPLKTEKGAIKQFLLLRNQSLCCYGVMPKITEWVNVKLAGVGLETMVQDTPVTVKGVLHVGAVVEDHAIVDVYRMDGAEMVDY